MNADVAFVTFMRFVSNMNKINPSQMDKYLTQQIALNNTSDRATLIREADSLSTLGDAYHSESQQIAQNFTGIPSKEARKEQKKIALKKGKAIKSAEKSLKRLLSQEGWQALNTAVETRGSMRVVSQIWGRRGWVVGASLAAQNRQLSLVLW